MTKTKEFRVSKMELEDARDAVLAHAKKWDRTDSEACAVFEELLRQVLNQPIATDEDFN